MSPGYITEDDVHHVLERELGQYFGKECMLTQSGYVANAGLMHAICDEHTVLYADSRLHASFHAGFRDRGAQVHFNAHNNMEQLEANIKAHGPGIILVESLYSITGLFTPLHKVVELKNKYGCVLVLDESHTLGVYTSKGYAHMLGLDSQVEFITSSLAKAWCTRAGIVLAPSISFVRENSYPFIFSSALVRNDITRIRAVFQVIKGADDRREKLMAAATLLRKEVSKIASVFDTPIPSPIVSIKCKNEEEMTRLHRHLSANGIMAAPFFAPTTPRKSPVLRMTVNSNIDTKSVFAISKAVDSFYANANAQPTARL